MWRSASRTGDVKTPQSKRSLVLPRRAVEALKQHKKRQVAEWLKAGALYHDTGLVFCYEDGRMFSRWALNWRFSKVTQRAGIGHWHAHEGRHTAVSIMKGRGVASDASFRLRREAGAVGDGGPGTEGWRSRR